MKPVRLVYVKNVICRTVSGVFQAISFAVRVQDIGFGKRVAIHWCGEDGVWRETPAEYRCKTGNQQELWTAEVSIPMTEDLSIPGNIEFAACLERDGQRYWDSRLGNNYRSDADSGVIVFDTSALRVIGFDPVLAPGIVSVPVEVAIRHEAEPEMVTVHWTVDGWVTQHQVHGHYRRNHWNLGHGSNARNPNRYGWEIWLARIPVQHASRLEYAVECRTRRRGVLWDSHEGCNYRAGRGTLRVMALNLHTYQEVDQQRKFAQVARAIRELNIDLACFQEVGEHWNNCEGDWSSNAARIINSHLPEPYHLYTDWAHLGFGLFREGVAILSRHPFVYVDSGYVSDGQNPFDIHSRKVVMAQVRVPYIGLVNVFSAHLSWPSGGFYPQFARLQRWADERHSPEVAATLICGDFNIPAGSDAYRHIVDTGQYEDQYLKIVSPSVFRRVFRDRQGDAMSLLAQDGRIDYLWLRSGSCLRAIHAEELFTPERYGRVSDHTAYLVEFEPR